MAVKRGLRRKKEVKVFIGLKFLSSQNINIILHAFETISHIYAPFFLPNLLIS